ncbi:MAG: hypothetical protein IJM44_06970 [Ruminococcus sp.]|nr:hypothetical protein [Ruminococcus sp.]
MKKRFFAIFTALLTLLCIVPLGAYALDFDPYTVEISFSGAPEGTYYVDLLVKMDSSDEHYTDFNAPPQCFVRRYNAGGNTHFDYTDLPGITSDSGIAKYNTDGYVSLLCHYSGAGMTIYDSEYNRDKFHNYDMFAKLSIPHEHGYPDFIGISDKYGAIRAAYVGKDGNVLGVTKKAETDYDFHEPYAFITDGDKLTFRIFGTSPAANIAFWAVVIGIPLLMIALIISKIRNAVWKRRTVNNIQEGAENGKK